jgi:hypothetical protein
MMTDLEECALKKTSNQNLGALIVSGTKIQRMYVTERKPQTPTLMC